MIYLLVLIRQDRTFGKKYDRNVCSNITTAIFTLNWFGLFWVQCGLIQSDQVLGLIKDVFDLVTLGMPGFRELSLSHKDEYHIIWYGTQWQPWSNLYIPSILNTLARLQTFSVNKLLYLFTKDV